MCSTLNNLMTRPAFRFKYKSKCLFFSQLCSLLPGLIRWAHIGRLGYVSFFALSITGLVDYWKYSNWACDIKIQRLETAGERCMEIQCEEWNFGMIITDNDSFVHLMKYIWVRSIPKLNTQNTTDRNLRTGVRITDLDEQHPAASHQKTIFWIRQWWLMICVDCEDWMSCLVC